MEASSGTSTLSGVTATAIIKLRPINLNFIVPKKASKRSNVAADDK